MFIINMLNQLTKEMLSLENKNQAQIYLRFFKTGRGEYGEGDVFLGIKTPMVREIAKKYYHHISLKDVEELLEKKYHEMRTVALVILMLQYKKAKNDKLTQRKIFNLYLNKAHRINNWDLVDISAPHIIGDFILKYKEDILRDLARSDNLWERRIAIVSTHALIKKRLFGETLEISNILINDEHDLIHKAVGWMLREVGKRNKNILEIFLKTRYKEMPRTMLRYAIEKFPEEERRMWLKGEF